GAQDQRGSAQGGHRSRDQGSACQDRQLLARDVAGRSARVRLEGAADLAAGSGQDRRQIACDGSQMIPGSSIRTAPALAALASTALALTMAAPAVADPVADFYRGKT